MSVMSEEVLPTTFDISFEDLSGAIRKQKCGLHSQQHQKTQGVQSKKQQHCFFNDFHDANLLGSKDVGTRLE